MIGLSGFILPQSYQSKLDFLSSFGIEFGYVFADIGGKNKTFTFLVITFFIVLKLKNSIEYKGSLKTTYKYLLICLILFFSSISMLSSESEFLYFNF